MIFLLNRIRSLYLWYMLFLSRLILLQPSFSFYDRCQYDYEEQNYIGIVKILKNIKIKRTGAH
jgi:hypothetical protein